MLVNHGPSQQSSKGEYKPWKLGATARYCASHTKTIYQRGSPCQDPADNRTTRRLPDHRKETQTAVKGKRRQGKQKKRLEDNIREWTGLEFAKSQRAVENRENWTNLVVKSSVVPWRPSRLRDRWWMLRDRWWWRIFMRWGHKVTEIQTEVGTCTDLSTIVKNIYEVGSAK